MEKDGKTFFNTETNDFDQWTARRAPGRWLKYTTQGYSRFIEKRKTFLFLGRISPFNLQIWSILEKNQIKVALKKCLAWERTWVIQFVFEVQWGSKYQTSPVLKRGQLILWLSNCWMQSEYQKMIQGRFLKQFLMCENPREIQFWLVLISNFGALNSCTKDQRKGENNIQELNHWMPENTSQVF